MLYVSGIPAHNEQSRHGRVDVVPVDFPRQTHGCRSNDDQCGSRHGRRDRRDKRHDRGGKAGRAFQ